MWDKRETKNWTRSASKLDDRRTKPGVTPDQSGTNTARQPGQSSTKAQLTLTSMLDKKETETGLDLRRNWTTTGSKLD